MKKRILVADDDDALRGHIVSLLTEYGYDVKEASSQSQLLEKLDDCDLWLIDIRLPTTRYEGILAVYTAIVEQKRALKPIIFMSVDDQGFAQEHLAGIKRLNIPFEWLDKPFELELLLNLARRLIR